MTYSNADFTPGMKGYSDIKPFRFWCQKVLPLVYDDSLSYYELLCKVTDYINNIITDLAATEDNVGALLDAYNQLQDYVNNYFTNLDVQEEINNKLDNLVEDGTLTELIGNYIQPRIDAIQEELDTYESGMNANFTSLQTSTNNNIRQQNNKIAVLEGRMDTFSNLTQGSTTGDAELQDIRVAYDGTVYPTAGDAVREQAANLNRDITALAKVKPTNLNLINYPVDLGYLNADGSITPVASTSTQRTTKPIYLANGEYVCKCSGMSASTNVYTARGIAVYNSDGSVASVNVSNNPETFTITDGQYVKINYNLSTINEFAVYNGNNSNKFSNHLNNDIGTHSDKFLDPKNGTLIDASYGAWMRGYLDTANGSLVPINGATVQQTTPFIELEKGVLYAVWCSYIISGTTNTQPRAIIIYKDNKSFSRSIPTTTSYTYFKLNSDEKYVRINAQFDTMSYFYLVDTRVGQGNSIAFLNDNVINTNKRVSNYVHARRPLIAFILDGEYDENDDMEVVFSSHNVNCGFAIQYNTTFTNIPLIKYLEWQRKGHEILAHSSVAVGTNGSATDAQIAQIVKDSYETLTDYGMEIHGFVALQGNTKPVTITNVKKWFDYGCDAPNHSGSYEGTYPDLVESNIFFNADNPYNLWRYSMQTSTLQQMKDAVDRCLSETGLLLFYGHAQSSVSDNFTAENLNELLTYIESVGGIVKKPYDAISDYYSIRYDDIMNQ